MTRPEEVGNYHITFCKAFLDYLTLCDESHGGAKREKYHSKLVLDCANGVGAASVLSMQQLPGFEERLQIKLINENDVALLNDGCGAEHVQKDQKLPRNWVANEHADLKCLSFDGDADRQMYFYGNHESKLTFVDGDKQFALIIDYIRSLLEKCGALDKLSHVLVQTAYCNSRVTSYLKKQGVENVLVKTGVKYAEPVVAQYDIGANDEPNGHGTVTYKQEALEAALKGNESIEARKLRAFLKMSNTVVGDSVANMLMIESILYDRDMTVQEFAQIYEENPARLYKIKVQDKGNFKTIEDESRLIEPAEVQADIDSLVSQVTEGKAFVRPSGTEDICRLYCEADSRGDGDPRQGHTRPI